MGKKRIVIKVQVSNEKSRVKIMKIIADAYGVTSVAIEGPDKDRVVVIGDGVDPVKLTTAIRKHDSNASLESVQNINNNHRNNNTEDEEDTYYAAASSSYCNSIGYPQPPMYYYRSSWG